MTVAIQSMGLPGAIRAAHPAGVVRAARGVLAVAVRDVDSAAEKHRDTSTLGGWPKLIEPNQFARLVERQPKGLGIADEAHRAIVLFVVHPVTRQRPLRSRQWPRPLVEADRLPQHAAPQRELADLEALAYSSHAQVHTLGPGSKVRQSLAELADRRHFIRRSRSEPAGHGRN
jgi:hypothetical protein